jgi:hypothetical protein
VFNGGVNAKALILVAAAAALMAGCGGGNGNGDTSTQAAGQRSTVNGQPSTTPQPATPSTTTDQPRPNPHRKVKQPRRGSSSKEPLKVTHSYTCNGKPLKALSAAGPVKVDPEIVKPGQPFTVTVTDKSVKVAVVTLTGVASKPIQVEGHPQDGQVTAKLSMPGYASCGNKLLEVEGDLSAEAYVGVAR